MSEGGSHSSTHSSSEYDQPNMEENPGAPGPGEEFIEPHEVPSDEGTDTPSSEGDPQLPDANGAPPPGVAPNMLPDEMFQSLVASTDRILDYLNDFSDLDVRIALSWLISMSVIGRVTEAPISGSFPFVGTHPAEVDDEIDSIVDGLKQVNSLTLVHFRIVFHPFSASK